ncbi:hypothetical protein PTI45_02281 [Paenibacillus nuruki]|uniref:HTH cro/C1-type domain-containing protein n=1 Tax=Paenibacillus nuruki TaxID=1886670 RepID=A0A1E3L3X8_9BACL|nr:helix-turn-helix transcriptional regulator [Paenibacillus nuruki]ODP28291.1 hypothetical protein PTI45_02281 [Paenibacillus nuruki]
MSTLDTVRSHIEQELQDKQINLTQFEKISGINRGVLSATLNSNPPRSISINQLDRMAAALDRPEGWLYEQYVEECFVDQKVNWRRIRALLLRCIQLNRNVLIQRTLYLLMEDYRYVPHVFELAEELVIQGQLDNSVPFYTCVIENERQQHAERLAISHYRLFRAQLSEDIERNKSAVTLFYPYRDRIPDHLRLDALLQMANVYYTVQEWDLMEQVTDEMSVLVHRVYEEECTKMDQQSQNYVPLSTERHLVVYYGQSYLLKSIFMEYTGKYKEGLKYIDQYIDLSEFKYLDTVGKHEVQKFKVIGQANQYNLRLLLGEINCLYEYADFIESYPTEWLPSLLIILTAANEHNIIINDILERFSIKISTEVTFQRGYYNEFTHNAMFTDFCYQLALYQIKNRRNIKELKNTLNTFDMSLRRYNMSRTMDYTSLLQLFIRSMP